MRTQRYPSDLTDEQWALVEPLIPVYPGGRPRSTSMRDVLDAIFYIVRTGCQWRYLPKDFPPKSTVWGYFDEWRHNGTLEQIHDALRKKVRRQEQRQPTPSARSIHSHSGAPNAGGGHTGGDGHKKVTGRKRPSAVEALGLLLAVVVTAASADDGAAAPQVLGQLSRQDFPRLRRLWADQKYHNHDLAAWVESNAHYELEVVRRPAGAKGFVLLPKRWVVERTFAWLKRYRRLSLDREKSILSCTAMIQLAMVHLMLNRLRPSDVNPEFQYRKVG